MTIGEQQREIARARERADLARLRFGNAVHAVVERLSPDRLRAEAIEAATDQFEQAKRDLLERFRHWPAALLSIGLIAAALIFWRPARIVTRHALRLASLAWATRDLWRRNNEQDRPKG